MMDLSIYGLSKTLDYVYVSLAYRSGSRRFRPVGDFLGDFRGGRVRGATLQSGSSRFGLSSC